MKYTLSLSHTHRKPDEKPNGREQGQKHRQNKNTKLSSIGNSPTNGPMKSKQQARKIIGTKCSETCPAMTENINNSI